MSTPYSRRNQLREFNLALSLHCREMMEKELEHLMCIENVQILRHGRAWSMTRDDDSRHDGDLTEHNDELVMRSQDVESGDVASFAASIFEVIESMSGSLARQTYSAVSEAASDVGNVTSIKEAGSVTNGILDMLTKVKFAVDESGVVTRPTLHIHPSDYPAIEAAAQEGGIELERRVIQITNIKFWEAMQDEFARLSRFGGAPS